jgi:MSHA biogenesis protein MshN
MSLINRVLQDLDRRQALDTPAAGVVKPSPAKRSGGEWFWRILVVLLTAALAWMGWVAVQLLPRKPLATELAFVAANEALTRADKPAAVPQSPAPSSAAAPAPAAVAAAPSAAAAQTPPAVETLRLATELQSPAEAPPVEAPAVAEPTQKNISRPAKKAVVKSASVDPIEESVDIDRPARPAATAERNVRRAAVLAKQGRESDAEELLLMALKAEPRNVEARQAYVSLLVGQHRFSMARRLLEVGLAADPKQSDFALELARIHAGERDYAKALTVLDKFGGAGQGAEFQAFRGSMLQRLERHAEAVKAYQAALGNGDGSPTAWISYGISLEALNRRTDAADAYRRALASGPITPEAREYAESRARALE